MRRQGRWLLLEGGQVTAQQAPYPVTPFLMPTMPWFSSIEATAEQPKYWDLSMLREREGSTTSIPSADSGFYEPSIFSPASPVRVRKRITSNCNDIPNISTATALFPVRERHIWRARVDAVAGKSRSWEATSVFRERYPVDRGQVRCTKDS